MNPTPTLLTVLLLAPISTLAADRPNILFILSDDKYDVSEPDGSKPLQKRLFYRIDAGEEFRVIRMNWA